MENIEGNNFVTAILLHEESQSSFRKNVASKHAMKPKRDPLFPFTLFIASEVNFCLHPSEQTERFVVYQRLRWRLVNDADCVASYY